VILGYADGTLSVINTKSQLATTKQTQMGRIISITFAPGKGNTTLLVKTEKELAVWDVREVSLMSRIKKKAMEILDADWTYSDQLAASMNDSSVRIFSFNFHLEKLSVHPLAVSAGLKSGSKEAVTNLLNILNQPDVYEKLEEHFQLFGSEIGLKFALLLRACLSDKWSRIDSWFLGGMANPDPGRIAINLESKLNRLQTMMRNNTNSEAQNTRNERRLSQLLTIFGKGHLALPILLGANSEQPDFMENSLRGLVQVMLQGDNQKVKSFNIHGRTQI